MDLEGLSLPGGVWLQGQQSSRAALWASDQCPCPLPPASGPRGQSPGVRCASSPLLSFLPGLTETLSTQPWAEDAIRQKGEGSTLSPVQVVETGP